MVSAGRKHVCDRGDTHKVGVRNMTLLNHDFYDQTPGRQSNAQAFADGEIYSAQLSALEGVATEREISIQLARSDDQRHSACDLINRRYSWRGYGDSHQLHNSSGSTTFTASVEQDVVGTITLNVDGTRGLAADQIFRAEIDKYRNEPGAQVCELTKFAFDVDGPSRPLLAALFHIVFIYGQRHYDCTDLFIEVNPRHRRFYQAMLGFKMVGDLKTNESVAAPSQLMHLKVADIRAMIETHRKSSVDLTSRSLYPFFLSCSEEEQVKSRLRRLITHAGDHRMAEGRMRGTQLSSISN
jgi:hypothetical protein